MYDRTDNGRVLLGRKEEVERREGDLDDEFENCFGNCSNAI